MGNYSIQHLLKNVIDFFDTIIKCQEFAYNEFGYGLISRSIAKFRAPKATTNEWFNEFGSEMPNIVKVTKVTNARPFDIEEKEFVGYEWVVPNLIMRGTKDGSLLLCVSFKNDDDTKFESVYIVGNHFATEQELQFINSHLYIAPSRSDKQNEIEGCVIIRNYRFSSLAEVGTTQEIEEIWKSVINT